MKFDDDVTKFSKLVKRKTVNLGQKYEGDLGY